MNLTGTPDNSAERRALRELVATRKVIVCVGSGGVGKTTTAAALGLASAAQGKKTLVITIDPARRLANALGLANLAHTPQRVDEGVVGRGYVAKAPLYAMMLDLKAAWDDMLLRMAPDKQTAERIFENRFYDALSRDLPGAHEFIACEALHHKVKEGGFDTVILDTPPTQNALDFLEAPARVLAVLDNDAFRFFASRSQGLGLRFLDGAATRAQSVLARFAGKETLEELGAFVVLLRDLYGPLTDETRAFERMLRSEQVRFVVVTSPQPAALSEARFFLTELRGRGLPCGAVVANRVLSGAAEAHAALATDRWEHDLHGPDRDVLVAALDTALRQHELLARADAQAIDAMRQEVGALPLITVPRLGDSGSDDNRLLEMLPWLVGPEP